MQNISQHTKSRNFLILGQSKQRFNQDLRIKQKIDCMYKIHSDNALQLKKLQVCMQIFLNKMRPCTTFYEKFGQNTICKTA